MPDYYSSTIVQPKIPLSDMTATEFLLLCGIFECEIEDGNVYFFAEFGPSDMPELDMGEVKEALKSDADHPTQTSRWLEEQLDRVGDNFDCLTVDISIKSYEFIFQEIVARSLTLSYVWLLTSHHCSKMRPDGFGGAASLITADQFRYKSTDEVLDDFFAELFPAGDPKVRVK